MMFTLQAFQIAHLDAMVSPDVQAPWARAWLEKLARDGTAVSATNGTGAVILAGGAVLVDPGVADVWMLTTDAARAQPIAMCKAIRAFLRHLFATYPLRRVQTFVDPTDARAVRFAERLGFVKEGRHPKRGPQGETMDSYAIVSEG